MKVSFSLIFILMIHIVSCGNSKVMESPEIIPQPKQNNEEAKTPNITLNPKIEGYITFDLLGGVFKKPEDSKSQAKSSTNSKPPSEAEEFSIDSSYNFIGHKGEGDLIISILAQGKDDNIMRRYETFTLRFIFSKYAYENPCLGRVHIHGEIHCDLQGDYHYETKKFKGDAHCINGPKENAKNILYLTKEKNFEVGLDANLKIDGDPFLYQSYVYAGKIMIEGVEKRIEELISEGASCS